MKKLLILLFLIGLCQSSLSASQMDNRAIKCPPENVSVNYVPAKYEDPNRPLCLLVSGDGGWKFFDDKFAEKLSQAGMPVVGISSFKYFWSGKTPETFVNDLTPVLEKYLQQDKRHNIVLIGHSFGANVIPFLFTRLTSVLQNQVKEVVLLSPTLSTDFKVHINEMLTGSGASDYPYDVVKEIGYIQTSKIICFYGNSEIPLVSNKIKQPNFMKEALKGGHHYDNEYDTIVKKILANL